MLEFALKSPCLWVLVQCYNPLFHRQFKCSKVSEVGCHLMKLSIGSEVCRIFLLTRLDSMKNMRVKQQQVMQIQNWGSNSCEHQFR